MGWLNIFVVYVALPALFFKLVSRTPIEQLARVDFIVASLLSTYFVFAIVFSIAVALRRASIADSTIQGLSAAYGNIGYMGPGLALLAFGEAAAIPVALIVCFENAMHFFIAPLLMAVTGGERMRLHSQVFLILRRVLLHPFIMATLAGIFVAGFNIPVNAALERLIDYLSQAAAPCALFAMGVTLAMRPLNRVPPELTYIIPAKLILHPLVMYLAMGLVGDFDPIWIYSAVLLASLPTATNVYVIAHQYGVWIERASTVVLVTTGLSVFTVSALLYAITTGFLPADIYVGR